MVIRLIKGLMLACFAMGGISRADPPTITTNSAAKLDRVAPIPLEKALETIEIADGFQIELVAAEPLVVDPVAMAFDEHGQLFVVEMRDYSEQDKERLGRVRLLIDKNGDGRFDTSHVFVDDLSWPTALACFDGGVFIANAPDILYCKDTNGDGIADVRRVVFTGFGRSNVQGLVNSFLWGLDQRIYGATSSSGGIITKPGSEESSLQLRGRDFVFDPKTSTIEATTGGGQHGMTFNRWGDRFVCHNSNHLQAIVFEERYLARNPYFSVVSARRSIAADGPQAAVYRISPVEAWRIARTEMRLAGLAPGPVEAGGLSAGYFTSATGVTVYEGGLWLADDPALVFVADVGSNLIHRKQLLPEGVTYRGERIDYQSEFVRSSDIWFRPVQMGIGPEGALYVLDMYRETIEHPQSLPPELKQQLDLSSGNNRGRIYRVAPVGYEYSAPKSLAGADIRTLVNSLENPNMWQRATASRLLYERQDPTAVPLLRDLARSDARPESRIAALYALATADALTSQDLIAALGDIHPQLRRHALRLSEPQLDLSKPLLDKALELVDDHESVVQFQLALTLGESTSPRATRTLAELLVRNLHDQDIVDATLTSIGTRPGNVLKVLLEESQRLTGPQADPVLSSIVSQIVRQRRKDDMAVLVASLNSREQLADGNLRLLKMLCRLPAEFLTGDDLQLIELRELRDATTDKLVREARRVLADVNTSVNDRVAAIENLALGEFESERPVLEELLSPQEPAAVREAVLTTCAEYSAPGVAELVLARWPGFLPSERTRATEILLRRQTWALALLDYLQNEASSLMTLEPVHVARLENYPSNAVRQLARELRGQSIPQDRLQVFEDYRESLVGGDVARGKAVFEKNCASCHHISTGGNAVGPNLAAMVSRGAESLLYNILDPNREVEPRFMEYVVLTTDGQVFTGIIGGETSTSVTLQWGENKSATVLRVDIDEMQNTGKSLMPEGFEKSIDKLAMADLLAYLQEAANAGKSK